MGHHHHSTIVLPLSLTIIFGSFTLGFYVAIQGPTLMDLIDLLHVNNDIMSHSLAVASLAYSVGGLLSGLLFNYVDRQILIPGYYIVFGMANILTPYITNYYVFSVVTVFKMMCAGGTDCGANVWILDMWPGKDAWLQALHFSFAVGCALGPLVVEPFLSANEHASRDAQGSELSFNQGTALINNENGESRIYIPYGVSGSFSLLAAFMIIFLYFLEGRRKRADAALAAARGDSPSLLGCPAALAPTSCGGQQAGYTKHSPGSYEHILMSAVQHPATLEAGLGLHARAGSPQHHQHQHQPLAVPDTIPEEGVPLTSGTPPTETVVGGINGSGSAKGSPSASPQLVRRRASAGTPTPTPATPTPTQEHNQEQQVAAAAAAPSQQQTQDSEPAAAAATAQLAHNKRTSSINSQLNQSWSGINQIMSSAQSKPSLQLADFDQIKFTSKSRETDGRPPYYVMFAIALSALCLSFYCGIEITSMNYLATFAVNIDLQLSKSNAAYMSSALTISFAVGRLFGIWIAAYMRPHKLFYLCSAIMSLGNLLILLFANRDERVLWASVCIFGIGCGPMYASIVSFYDDKIAKVTNTVSGIFILGSMFNNALNTVIMGHTIIDNALILIICNLIGAVSLLCLFGSLHALTHIKKNQRKRKFKSQQLKLTGVSVIGAGGANEKSQQLAVAATTGGGGGPETGSGATHPVDQAAAEQQVALLSDSNSDGERKDPAGQQSQAAAAPPETPQHEEPTKAPPEVGTGSPPSRPSNSTTIDTTAQA